MASGMKKTTAKRNAKAVKAGRKRKNKDAQRSTLAKEELFAELDKAAGKAG
jgi:hypothetical protein